MKRILLFIALLVVCLAPDAMGQDATASVSDLATAGREAADGLLGEGRLSTAVEIALLLTVLSMLPAVLVTITSFTRIVIVLSFVRRALSINELPPNPVLLGLALFLTMFVMAPVAERVHSEAWVPYQAGEKSVVEASEAAWMGLSEFLVSNTRHSELALFTEIAHAGPPSHEGQPPAGTQGSSIDMPEDLDAAIASAQQLPVSVIIPAFVLSELKTAFQMGFLLFLPFLVIDLVVSSVLLSMGMFMLPPVMISTPIKILVFVLVDGWHLITQSVVSSFIVS